MASSSTAPLAGPWAHGRSWRVPVNDVPWRRLPVILPIAIALWVLGLWAFGRFMSSPPEPPPEQPPLDAQIIELPPEPPPAPPPPQPVVKPPPQPREPVRRAPTEPSPPAPVQAAPAVPAPALQPAEPTPAAKPADALPPQPPPANPNHGRLGAHAIYQPALKIPDDLREQALSTTAVARFSVAVDGSVSVELIKPTPNPRLNQILLEQLKAWKFFPATEDGKPVVSSQDIRVKVDVQ
jgi:protein TonB